MQVQHFIYFTPLCALLTFWVYTPLLYQNLSFCTKLHHSNRGRGRGWHQFSCRKQILVHQLSFMVTSFWPLDSVFPSGLPITLFALSNLLYFLCLYLSLLYALATLIYNVSISQHLTHICFSFSSSDFLLQLLFFSFSLFQLQSASDFFLVNFSWLLLCFSILFFFFSLNVFYLLDTSQIWAPHPW